ncbi:hypothetical protein ACP70R_007915 [Stipagrostis hirtigluma subsp. patula]
MEQQQQEESAVAGAQEQEGTDMGQLLSHFERILHQDPLIDEVGFLHPTQFCSLDRAENGNLTSEAPQFQQRYFWCRDHKLAISSEILPSLYRAARDAYTGARTARDAPLPTADLMSHSKALLILCPDFLTAWNSRKMVLHRRWVLKKLAEQHQDMSELIEKESVLVKEIAEKSKMNYRAWRHRCWLIPYMTREQVLDELKKSTKWSELHIADNCCFHYRRSLLLALLDSHLEDGEDSHRGESETYLLWKEELRWDEMLIRRYQGRESLWIHRRFLSQWWIQRLLTVKEIGPSPTSLVDLFVSQEIHLVLECLNAPADEFEESRAQAELAALYILWISKQVPGVKVKLEERLHCSMEDLLGRACRLEKRRLWMSLLGLPAAVDQSR